MLDKKTLRAINRAKKILIVPFPAAMWGGKYSLEQMKRLETAFRLWEFIGKHSGKGFPAILCAGGLANYFGTSLAKSMAQELLRLGKRTPIKKYLIRDEEDSTHTGEQVRLMKFQILDGGYDLLLPVSGYWHLKGIVRLFRNCGYPMPIVGVPSPTAGSILHRASRAVQEMIRVVMIETIDRRGRYFDRDAARRKSDACSKA